MDIKFNIKIIKRFILENKKKSIKISSIAAICLIAVIIYLTGSLNDNKTIVVLDSNNNQISTEQNQSISGQNEPISERNEPLEKITIVVDIEGAVVSPGVFYLEEDSRVNDAVLKAGGLTEDADTRWVNLAAKLSDGDKVYIPKKEENINDTQNTPGAQNSSRPTNPVGIITQSTTGGSASVDANASATSNEKNGLININTATSAQLQTLSGIGPVTAQKIIDYRENVGKFSKIEDIMRVSGIGVKTFESLKDKIVV